MTDSPDKGIGVNIAAARKLRGFTQHELADAAYVSISLLTKVESGHKAASPALISAVARTLRVKIEELTGQPYRGGTTEEDEIHAPIAELRREVTVYDLPPDHDVPILDLDQLALRTKEATHERQSGNYFRLGAVLPRLLLDLRAATHANSGSAQERAFGLLAESYDSARALAYKLGYLDLAALLVTRHAYAAERSGDPLEAAVGDTMRAHEMINVGEFRAAENLMVTTLGRIEDEIHDDHPASLAVSGYLHLEAGLASARNGDPGTTETHLSEARRKARRLAADGDDYRLAFGPTNVDIWSVALPVELCDASRALDRAQHIHLPSGAPRERSSHYYIDLARAYVQQNRPHNALDALMTARKLSPLHTRYHPMVRESTRAISRLLHRPNESLRSFSAWLQLVR